MKNKYVKLNNGILVYANQKKIKYGGKWWFNAPAEIYLAAGWKTLVENEMPNDIPEDYYYVPNYIEDDEHVYVVYELVKVE